MGTMPLDATLVENNARPFPYNPRLEDYARAPVSPPPEGTTRLAVFRIAGDKKQVIDVSNPKTLAAETTNYRDGLALTMHVYEVPTVALATYAPGGSPVKMSVEAPEPARPGGALLKKIRFTDEVKEVAGKVWDAVTDALTIGVTSPGSIPEIIETSARDIKHSVKEHRKANRQAGMKS